MTEIRKRESLLGIGHKKQPDLVNDQGDTVAEAESDGRDSSLGVTAEIADGCESPADTLTRVKVLMAEPPTAKSARP
jgi:hypothetical protein